MKTYIDNALTANNAQAGRQNGALTDTELELVVAAGGPAGVNPSRADRGLAGRSA